MADEPVELGLEPRRSTGHVAGQPRALATEHTVAAKVLKTAVPTATKEVIVSVPAVGRAAFDAGS